MALLPNPDELQRVTPQPSSGVASYTPDAVDAAQISQGQQISQMAAQETAKLDQLKTTDAETQLMQKELDLKTEYSGIKGGGVLMTDFNQNSQDQYKGSVQSITDSLATPAQKAQFQQIAARRAVAFDAGRISYAMGEAYRFRGQVYIDRLGAIEATAMASYTQPDVVAQSMLSLEDTYAKEMVRLGVSDPDMLSQGLAALRSDFYSKILTHELANNDTASANATFAAAGNLLTDQQKQAFADRLKPANDFAEGQKLAVQAQSMIASGKPLTEVELTLTKSATTPGAYNAAKTIFNNLEQANDKAQAQAEGSVLMLYHQSGNPVAAKAAVLGSQQFQSLTPMQQSKVYDYMGTDERQDIMQNRQDVQFGQSQKQFAWSQTSHAHEMQNWKDEDANRAEAAKYKTPQAMASFYGAITDPTLATKSHAEIWGKYGPTIGPALTAKVIDEFDTVVKQQKPLELDDDILEAAKPAGLKKNITEANNDAFKGFVKSSLMDWQAQHPGKAPTPDDQRAIAASANTTYGENHWYAPSPAPAYQGPPSDWVQKLQTSSSKINGKPLTDAQVQTAWRKRALSQTLQGQ